MLNEFDRVVLLSICRACKMSKSAHVPEKAFARRHIQAGREVKKSLRKLISLGYVTMHPTRGEMSYALNIDGIILCREMLEDR